MTRQIFTEFHDSGAGIIFKIKKEVYSAQSDFQKIEIFDTETYGKLLVLDGLVMLTERDEFVYHEMLVHPAFSFKEKVEKVGVIGGGDGGTVREVLKYSEVKSVFLVEIDRLVIEASIKYLPFTSSSLKDEKVKIFCKDGYKFLKENNLMFDLLFIDSSDPIGPAVKLYSMDFYESVKKNLRSDGIVVFQSESPWYHLDVITKQIDELKKIFKNVKLYLASIPSYPGGLWSFTIAADIDFIKRRNDIPSGLRYYNEDLIENLFVLPKFIKDATG